MLVTARVHIASGASQFLHCFCYLCGHKFTHYADVGRSWGFYSFAVALMIFDIIFFFFYNETGDQRKEKPVETQLH